ncbi:MAG: hypothetical protein LBT27_04180 [Prevotellaceae bacterium]|nr:hypothetical protein [Prevotellaceae bacterium]
MINTIKYIKLLFCTIVCCLAFSRCDTVHEFPDENAYNPYLININLLIDIDMNMDSDTIYQTYAEMLNGDYDIRYIIDIYETDPERTSSVSNRVKHIVKTEGSIINRGTYRVEEKLSLPAKDYKVIAWIDFVDKQTNSDKYYNTADLQNISIIEQANGRTYGYNTTKDAFTGIIDMNLVEYDRQRFVHRDIVVPVKRPFAVYRIITTDIEQYITYHQPLSYSSIMPASTLLVYNLFLPVGYNAFLHRPDNFKTGINYTYNITELIPQKEAIIASDIVFVDDDTFYSVNFEILSADNEHINTINGLNINLKRNKMTIIRGEFLTKNINDGGIGIDDGFGEEIIINL